MITHRRMNLAELDRVLGWAAEEGWNPGLSDAAAFHAADPAGFFLAEEDGVPVAAISVVNHSADFAFLGLYLCRPAHRGRGIGLSLWTHALAHAGGRTVGLDGVPAQQANYARSGFVRAGETVRYVGRVKAARRAGIRRVAEADVAPLVRLEAAASGWEKRTYLSAWFREDAHRVTLVAVRDGVADGLATVRRCREGAKIGPLVARDADQAHALICCAAAEMGEEVTLDVPRSARTLVDLCEALGLAPGFETARMYRGPAGRATSDCHAVTSLELG